METSYKDLKTELIELYGAIYSKRFKDDPEREYFYDDINYQNKYNYIGYWQNERDWKVVYTID